MLDNMLTANSVQDRLSSISHVWKKIYSNHKNGEPSFRDFMTEYGPTMEKIHCCSRTHQCDFYFTSPEKHEEQLTWIRPYPHCRTESCYFVVSRPPHQLGFVVAVH